MTTTAFPNTVTLFLDSKHIPWSIRQILLSQPHLETSIIHCQCFPLTRDTPLPRQCPIWTRLKCLLTLLILFGLILLYTGRMTCPRSSRRWVKHITSSSVHWSLTYVPSHLVLCLYLYLSFINLGTRRPHSQRCFHWLNHWRRVTSWTSIFTHCRWPGTSWWCRQPCVTVRPSQGYRWFNESSWFRDVNSWSRFTNCSISRHVHSCWPLTGMSTYITHIYTDMRDFNLICVVRCYVYVYSRL